MRLRNECNKYFLVVTTLTCLYLHYGEFSKRITKISSGYVSRK